MMAKLRASVLACTVIGLLGATSAATAQQTPVGSDDNTALRPAASPKPGEEQSFESLSADKLFLEGRALIRQGKPQDACRMLERSHELAPTLATLLNLGLCHRFSGHLATAHNYYRQAEIKATLDGDTQRRDFAHEEAAALSSQRASLTLRIPGTADAPLEVRIDDVVQPREVWERPMFIDAGEHRIAVHTHGKLTWEGFVQVVDGNKHVVVIPEQKSEAASEVPRHEVAAPVVTALPPPPPSVQLKEESGPSAARVVAVSVAGAGVIALGASLVFTILASNNFEASNDDDHCGTEFNVCDDEGLQLRERAQTQATYATVLSISGAVAVAGGVALWFLSPGEPEERKPLGSVSIRAGPHDVGGVWTTSF